MRNTRQPCRWSAWFVRVYCACRTHKWIRGGERRLNAVEAKKKIAIARWEEERRKREREYPARSRRILPEDSRRPSAGIPSFTRIYRRDDRNHAVLTRSYLNRYRGRAHLLAATLAASACSLGVMYLHGKLSTYVNCCSNNREGAPNDWSRRRRICARTYIKYINLRRTPRAWQVCWSPTRRFISTLLFSRGLENRKYHDNSKGDGTEATASE